LLGATDYFAAGSRTMMAQVPLGHIRTLYVRTGDLFAWLCVAGVVVAVSVAAVSAGTISTRAIDADTS
jgi:apolipoprotein N-acyltransferase